MTDTAPAARLRDLVLQWKRRAEWNRCDGQLGGTSEALVCAATFESCADELEAVLVRAVEEENRKPEVSHSARLRDLIHAAELLAKSLPDECIEALRSEWGNTNLAVLKHWRDEVLALVRAVEAPAQRNLERR